MKTSTISSIPTKISDRLIAGIKFFKPILEDATKRDLKEADTSRTVVEILSDVFGFDKFSEIGSEVSARGKAIDHAVFLDGNKDIPRLVIEVKAIGHKLVDNNVKQAVDYGTCKGTKWAVLTNGIEWRIYRVSFPKPGKPTSEDLVAHFTFTTLDHKSETDLQMLYLITKEGLSRAALEEFDERQEAMSRFFLGATILSDPVAEVIRRELRRAMPGVRIALEEVQMKLREDVLKGEVQEGQKFEDACRKIKKAQAQRSKGNEPEVGLDQIASKLISEVPPLLPQTPFPSSVPSVPPSAPSP